MFHITLATVTRHKLYQICVSDIPNNSALFLCTIYSIVFVFSEEATYTAPLNVRNSIFTRLDIIAVVILLLTVPYDRFI